MAKAPASKSLVSNARIQAIIKASGNIYADTVQDSEVVNNKDSFCSPVYGLNIALSGELDQGMNCGSLQLVGETRCFKTLFLLVLAKAYLDKYEDAIFILFDSEHGASREYFESVGIDPRRVVHCPIKTVEDLRGQANKIMDTMTRGEHIFFGVDSIGLLASKKEVKDAISDNEAADMTRAKALNSFFRTIVSQLPVLNVPMVIVNHSYASMGSFVPTEIVKGGKNAVLAANDIWFITRANDRETTGDKELNGFKFTIKIHKSRKAKEQSKIPIMVSFDEGIDNYSGLLDIAIDGGFIVQPTQLTYRLVSEDDSASVRLSKTDAINKKLDHLIHDDSFKAYIKDTYKQAGKKLLHGVDEDGVVQEGTED